MRKGEVLSNVISSQAFHATWGGVIPELASRAHLENIAPVIQQALNDANIEMQDVSALACTTQPGLLGALLVGANYAKGLALRFNLPCVPVHHIEAHLYSAFLEDETIQFPYLCLVVSGGHTSLFYVTSFHDYQILGSTRDDAAGEAFDKTAKLLGLGYPGGALIDKRARRADKDIIAFPRALLHDDTYEFSFSGMKTAVRNYLHQHHPEGIDDAQRNVLCASIQEAIVDVLATKTLRAAREYKVNHVVIAGGVSANSRLRELMTEAAQRDHYSFVAPRLSYSLDNAAMIAFVASRKLAEQGSEAFRSLDFAVSSKALRMHRHGNANGG